MYILSRSLKLPCWKRLGGGFWGSKGDMGDQLGADCSDLGCLDQVSGSEGGKKWLNSRQISKGERTGCDDGSSGVSFIDDMFSFSVVVRGKDGWSCGFYASESIWETDDIVEG